MKFFYALSILLLAMLLVIQPSQSLPVDQINLLDLELAQPHTDNEETLPEADLQRVTRGLGGFDFGGKFGGLGLGGLKGGFGGLGHGFGGGFGGLGHGFGGGLGSFKGLFNKF